jgi:hypothetical protein
MFLENILEIESNFGLWKLPKKKNYHINDIYTSSMI